MQLWGLVLVNVIAICIAQKHIPQYDFVIGETSYNKLCTGEVSVMTVNGSIPGPALNLTKGQTFRVNVYNQGQYGLTIHWHGVKQPRNPWSDGPEYITQCPIKPGSNFTYEVILSDEEGTLWWHAHSEWTRATVYGSMSIRPGQGKQYPYPMIPDADQQIILGTWFNKDVMDMVRRYRQNGTDFDSADALTINGQPGDSYNLEGCTPGMFTMTMEFNKTYLLRIVNAAMNEDLAFAVANHTLIVVGVDAALIEPIYTDNIMISPGQTMDVLLVANQTRSHYYMAARSIARGTTQTTTGLIQYAGNYTPPATAFSPDLPTSIDVANFTQRFRSLSTNGRSINVPRTVDTRVLMTVAINNRTCTAGQNCNYTNGASLSNVTFVAPTVDVLQAYWLNLSGVYKTDFPYIPRPFDYTNSTSNGVGRFSEVNGTRVFVVDYNSVVEMVIQGTDVVAALPHPIHLHGYSFYSVASGAGNYNASNVTYNTLNPPLINTVALPRAGWTAIRFRADNPGVWFIHCHLERHLTFGMETVMIVKNGPTRATRIRPPHYNLTGTC